MPYVRKDVWALGNGWNDTLLWYAKAIRVLQARPITDPSSWRFLAAIHGFHPTVWKEFGELAEGEDLPPDSVTGRFWAQCQHQSWYFLPWHRGYLASFEQIVRAAVVAEGGPEDWALPYWNYSDPNRPETLEIPQAFELATLPDGSDNPLRIDRRFGDGTHPIRLDPRIVSLRALGDDEFEGGTSDIPPGFGGPSTTFHHGPESETTNGGLEALPHNPVHGAVGGSVPGEDPNDWWNLGLMSIPVTAGLDPVFWLHHANIDRLWSVWLRDPDHQSPSDAAWTEGPFDRAFVMPRADGSEWRFAARDMLDTTAPPLDYRYEDETGPQAARRFRVAGRGTRGAALEGMMEGAPVAKRKSPNLIGATESAVRVSGTTDAPVRLDRSAGAALRESFAAPSALESANAEAPASGRIFLKLEGIRGTSDAAVYHAYVGLKDKSEAGSYPEHLAGTVSLFGVSAASDPNGPNAGSGINQVLEITEIVEALHMSGDDLARLDVRFVPANETVARADFSIDRVSVFQLDT